MLKKASAYFIFAAAITACEPQQKPAELIRSPSAEPASSIMSPAEKRSFYRWLVNEMQEQIFLRPAKNKADTDAWINIFAQGASIEGVYHGLVLSSDYAAMERGKANVQALRWFAAEMSNLENPLLKESDPAAKASVEKFAKEHLSASLFTLKRELGEQLLAEIDKRKNDREKLSDWYSSLAVRWARTDVSFGMPSRNKSDLGFHKAWAKENSLGLIQWEVLNRAHRILNNKGGVAIVIPNGK